MPEHAGSAPDTAQIKAAHARADETVTQLLFAAGDGPHDLTCALTDPPAAAQAIVMVYPETGVFPLSADDIEMLMTLVTYAFTRPETTNAGLLLNSPHRAGGRTIRGWGIHQGKVIPLTADQARTAYCTDPSTGDQTEPDHDTVFEAGFPLRPPALPL
ncbi:hypothetical protein ACFV42_42460 [Streptomyces solisilvae]|uniref:hypothetical protein n=1 Tax=Streptomyces malaysiensis TaxID=92644 RepID=UPI0036A7DB9F